MTKLKRKPAELVAIGDDAKTVAAQLRFAMAKLSQTAEVALRDIEEATRQLPATRRGELYIMSAATLDDLLSERADAAGAAAAIADRRSDERVPAAVVDRLLAGEHPVRVWRDHRGLTLERLHDKAGLSIGYLSEIEAGKKPGSLKALRAIATALKIDLDDVTAWLPQKKVS
jgi:hypothetical protein